MAKSALKLSTMVGENFEIYCSQMAKNAFKLSTMVGDIFEIYLPEMAKSASNCQPWLEKFLKMDGTENSKTLDKFP